MTLLGRRIGICLLAPLLVAAAFAALLLGAQGSGAAAAPKPTGYWKMRISLDLTSSGTATASRCFPDPEQVQPTPPSAGATQKVSVRTTRPTTVEFHETPGGVPVAGETGYTTSLRAKVAETRASELNIEGEPLGCFGGDRAPKSDCGTESLLTGIFMNPVGGVRNWKGFKVELQEDPAGRFERCGLAEAQFRLGGLDLEIETNPRKLTGKAGRLVFRGSKALKASASEEGVKSTATGTLKYTVALTRTGNSG